MGGLLDIFRSPETKEVVAQLLTQILAFFILVWFLKKYTWKPIIRMLDARGDKIAGEFKRIDEIERQVQELRQEYDRKIRNIDLEARVKIQDAIREGRRIAREITDTAREEADSILDRARQSLEIDVSTAKTQIRDEIINLVMMATRNLIHERLDEPKHRELIQSFIEDLGQT